MDLSRSKSGVDWLQSSSRMGSWKRSFLWEVTCYALRVISVGLNEVLVEGKMSSLVIGLMWEDCRSDTVQLGKGLAEGEVTVWWKCELRR